MVVQSVHVLACIMSNQQRSTELQDTLMELHVSMFPTMRWFLEYSVCARACVRACVRAYLHS
jgi:hypothetical protein